MASIILPVAKAIYLCDYQFGYEDGRVDLYGIFHGIRPSRYPHVHRPFCVFAQLVGGRGRVPFFIDVVYAPESRLVHTTETHRLFFQNRTTVVQMAMRIDACPFQKPGLYLFELFCDNTPIADTSLELL